VVFPNEASLFRVHENDDLRDRKHTYDTAIRGNSLPFAEAHRRVLEADLSVIQRRREQLELAAIAAVDAKPE
ncbi:MAG: hypothetical protein AAF658_03235, partial [Myxococcota bacterium]